MFIHERGFLHNELKSNNVVIDGSENKPVIIDFGKSCKIVKARLRKPKVNIEKSMKNFRTSHRKYIAVKGRPSLEACFRLAIWSLVYLKTLR